METNNLQNNNEIDLLDLLKKMGQGIGVFCQYIGKILAMIILFLIRKSLWLAAFVVIGIIAAVFFYKTSPRTYSSMMMVRANVLDNTFMINQVRELGRVRDTLTFARMLNIPDTAAKHIIDLDAFYGIATPDGALSFIDTEHTYSYDPNDSLRQRMPQIFYVRLKTDNENLFSFVGSKLIQTLTANPYIIANNELRLDQQRARLVEVTHQLSLLDSLQQTDYFKNQRETKASLGQLLLTTEKDRQLYHDHVFNIYSSKQSIEASLAEVNAAPLTVMQDFTALSVVDNPLVQYLKFWVTVFFFLGLGFVVLRHFWKKIWQLIIEKN